jgi:phospholipase/carboxylesterase
MNASLRYQQIGPLRCAVFDPEENPSSGIKLAAVFCHGFGAPGDDLVPIGPHLASLIGPDAEGIRFYFPQAPLSLEASGMPGARAWWMLDLEMLQLAAQGQLPRDQRDTLPDGLESARDALAETVDSIEAETGLSAERLILGGFSQGSMIATELTLTRPATPAALAIFSGTLLCESRWRNLVAEKTALKVFQSHGRADNLLPFSEAEALHSMFVESGIEAEFLPFFGAHTIPPEALQRTATLLQEYCSG